MSYYKDISLSKFIYYQLTRLAIPGPRKITLNIRKIGVESVFREQLSNGDDIDFYQGTPLNLYDFINLNEHLSK